MAHTITEEDEGKNVLNADGKTIGRVVEVRGDTAYVDPDPGITETVKSKLGWGDVDEDTYPLESSEIDRVSDDELQLRRL